MESRVDRSVSLTSTRRGEAGNPILRVVICVGAVVAVIVVLVVIRVQHDRLLSAGLNLFLALVLVASIRWGTRYAILVSFLSAVAFSGLLPPAGHLHLDDVRVWTLLTACLVTGIIASQLSRRVRRSEKELREAIEAIPAMVWTALPDGSSAFVNRRWTEYTGLSREDTAGSGWQTVIYPEDVERHVRKWRAALATGQPFENEARFRRAADGRYRWFLVRGVPLKDEAGNVLKWYGTLIDIEDRKGTEEALKQSGRYLAETQRLTHIGSFIWDVQSRRALYLSEEWYRIFGFDSETNQDKAPMEGDAEQVVPRVFFEGRAWEERLERIHPEDRDKWQAAVNRAINEKSDYEVEFRAILPDRVTKYLYAVGHPVLNASGEVVQFMGSVADITERKQAEEALRRTEAYLTEAQRLTHTGSWVWDVRTREASHLSDEWYRIYGLDSASNGRAWEKRVRRVHPEDRGKWEAAVDRAISEKSDYELEYRLLLPDGVIKHIHVVGHPVVNSSGDLVQFMGSVTDITERKRAEEERERLRHLETELARINRVTTMGELTASLAHEVNQPIAAAVTNANTSVRWLVNQVPNIEEAREAAKRAAMDATRAAEIVNRIRSLFRKGEPPQRELVDINQVIDEMIVLLLRTEANRHGVSIHSELEADLPEVRADRVQLQQVVLNLMMNGIDAMEHVESPRMLTLRSKRDGTSHLLVSVNDTGVGLPADRGKIFEAFFTTKPHGTGMGLAISRTIIESHGGQLWATSNPEGGSTFYFTLPTTVHA